MPPGSNTAPAPSPSKAREVTVGSNPAADIDRDIATIQTLRRAAALYETFVEKAGDEPAYEEAVRRSRERIDDINETITFLEQGIALRAKRDRLESR